MISSSSSSSMKSTRAATAAAARWWSCRQYQHDVPTTMMMGRRPIQPCGRFYSSSRLYPSLSTSTTTINNYSGSLSSLSSSISTSTPLTNHHRTFHNLHLHHHDNNIRTVVRRSFSSNNNLMGYSPMSPGQVSPSNSNSSSHIPTANDVSMSGGVWAPTSAKRDKLGELKAALKNNNSDSTDDGNGTTTIQKTLDDVATPAQQLDLWLADGIALIAKVVDTTTPPIGSTTSNEEEALSTEITHGLLDEFLTWLDAEQQPTLEGTNNNLDNDDTIDDDDVYLNQTQFESKLQIMSAKITNLLDRLPPPTVSLANVRDYLDPDQITIDLQTDNQFEDSKEEFNVDTETETALIKLTSNPTNTDHLSKLFDEATVRYRLLLIQSVISQLQDSKSTTWTTLTTVSDADIDRAAVEGRTIVSPVDVVSWTKIMNYIQSHVTGSCHDRVTAAWKLIDRDNDGRLDEIEMNHVCQLCLEVEQTALSKLFDECLTASPVRNLTTDGGGTTDGGPTTSGGGGWRQRRQERKVKKHLRRMFQKSIQNHFEDEVEMNHRLRCIYAWANKQHQSNKIESVLVEGGGGGGDSVTGWIGTGRKRYVELSPKISLEEFREVQKVHFQHLDRIGVDIVHSFREDLWVDQGKGRERRELIRDSLLFLTVVSAVDFVILTM